MIHLDVKDEIIAALKGKVDIENVMPLVD
jgi:hypothetical protein